MQFEWQLPTRVVFGAGRFQSAHKYVRGLGKRAYIITSASFANSGARASVLESLLAQLSSIQVETKVFSEIEPNPRTTTIDRAALDVRAFRPRFVIALGGGSVMDAAKCLAMLAVNDGDIYEYAYRGLGKSAMKPFNHALPIVCIPTIAATSSETDLYAVVTNWDEHKKVTIFNEALIPTLSIIDPELTYSVPAAQTVHGAFDMITHVMESYLSSPKPAPLQDRMTEAFIETVVEALPRVLTNPRDELGRSQLSWCASLALSGVLSGRNGGWPVHALEHGISAYTDGSHGLGLALLLPRVMAYDAPAISEKLIHFNKKIFGVSESTDPIKALDQGLVRFMKDVGAWVSLADVVKDDSVVDKAVDHAFEMKAIWKRGDEPYLDNCRRIYRKDAIEILDACRTRSSDT